MSTATYHAPPHAARQAPAPKLDQPDNLVAAERLLAEAHAKATRLAPETCYQNCTRRVLLLLCQGIYLLLAAVTELRTEVRHGR